MEIKINIMQGNNFGSVNSHGETTGHEHIDISISKNVQNKHKNRTSKF